MVLQEQQYQTKNETYFTIYLDKRHYYIGFQFQHMAYKISIKNPST